MKRWARFLLASSAATLIALSIFSCSQAVHKPPAASSPTATVKATPPPVTTQPGVEQKTLAQTKPPTVQSATITFLTGDVQSNVGGGWQPASIGDELSRNERVKTGADSFCEVQFGNLATARIESDSEVSIAKLVLGQSRQVNVALSTGAIVSKVQKLVGKDQYDIATQTAVAGVRGTEFRVAASSNDTTELSVKEGVVTVVPPQASIAGATPEQQAVAQQVERTMLEKAPRVTADQQLVVTAADFAPVVQQLAVVKKQIDAGATAATITPLVEASAATAQRSVPKATPITQKQQKALAVTDTMQLLPTTAAAAPSTQTSSTVAPPPRTVPLSVSVLPTEAQIYLNGQFVGTNGFSALFRPGQSLSLSVRLTGYQTKELPITVPETGVGLTISLTKVQQKQTTSASVQPQPAPQPAPQPVKVTMSVSATPATAQILVDGRTVGTGSYQGQFSEGQRIQIVVQASGYTSESRTVVAGRNTGTLAFRLSKKIIYGSVSVSTAPSDAAIYIDGQYEGTGSYSSRFPENRTLRIRASLRGYSDATSTVTVAANRTTNTSLTLVAHPIDARISVSGSPLVRTLAVWNNNLISVDRTGTLRSTSRNGTPNWEVNTGNAANENSQPVVADGTVFLSGARSFVGVDASTGARLFRINLGPSEAHLFGRSVSVANGELYYPANNAVIVYGERTGRVVRRIALPNNSNMSALVKGNHLYIVDQQGKLYDLNTQNGRVNGAVTSSAVQPVASAPVMLGSKLFFAGRRGTAVLADVSTNRVIWQKPLSPKRSIGVFTDPVFTSSGIYVFGNNTIFGLSPSGGGNLFSPITKVSAPPLLDGSTLYYGTTGGMLVKANARTGAVEATLDIGSKITTRPAMIGGDIAVGTESGEIVLVYPRTM